MSSIRGNRNPRATIVTPAIDLRILDERIRPHLPAYATAGATAGAAADPHASQANYLGV
jgi:hypothetical protein